jgi:predicted nucleic acid-binding protein
MKVFLDANILVAVLNKEYPLFTYAVRVLSLADDKRFQLYTSSTAFAIAFYFSSKRSGASKAKEKMAILAQKIKLAENKQHDILAAVTNKKITDFEDGIQYYAALNAGCKCIVTENLSDYFFSEIEVLNADNFLQTYVLK